MENQNNTFDPNTFDWEEYDRLSKENIKKLGELEKQILLDMFSQEYKQVYPNEQFYKL